MKKTSGVALTFIGILVGCGAATVAPSAISHAQPKAGAWGCYVADRFPDARAAAEWSGSVAVKQGLDQVAPMAATGTILTIAPKGGGYPDVICVKN
jgi:hypothetical protein